MVWVNAYTRVRFGRLEHVSAHWRSLPEASGLGSCPGLAGSAQDRLTFLFWLQPAGWLCPRRFLLLGTLYGLGDLSRVRLGEPFQCFAEIHIEPELRFELPAVAHAINAL